MEKQKEVMLVMGGEAIQNLEAFIQDMPFKYANPLLQQLAKHIRQVEEDSKDKKK